MLFDKREHVVGAKTFDLDDGAAETSSDSRTV